LFIKLAKTENKRADEEIKDDEVVGGSTAAGKPGSAHGFDQGHGQPDSI
jgi:hypothetical protein